MARFELETPKVSKASPCQLYQCSDRSYCA